MTFILRNIAFIFIYAIHLRIAYGEPLEDAQQSNSTDITRKMETDGIDLHRSASNSTKTIPTKDDRTLSLGNTGEITSLIMENINNLLTGTNLKDKQSLITFPTKKPLEDKDKFDGAGVVNSIEAIKDDLNKLSNSFNIFKIIDTFIEQWRNSLPLIAVRHFTWLQAALLCAVGSIAAGAAIITAEAFYFKTQRDNEEYAKLQKDHYQQHYAAKLPSLTYGRRNYEESLLAVPAAVTMSPAALEKYYNDQWKRMNKPQSLKRNQRRRQRKNKNTAGILWRKPEPAAGLMSKRIRRQITEPMIEPQPPKVMSADMPSAWHSSTGSNSFNQFEYSANKNFSEGTSKNYSYWTRKSSDNERYSTTPVNSGNTNRPTISPAVVTAAQGPPATYQQTTNQQYAQYYQYRPSPPPLIRRTETNVENSLEKPTASKNILDFFRNSVTKLLNFVINGNRSGGGGEGNGATRKTGQASQGPYFLPAGPLKAGLSVPGLNQNRNIINF